MATLYQGGTPANQAVHAGSFYRQRETRSWEWKTAVSLSKCQAYTHLYLILPTIPSPVVKLGEFWAYSTYIS